MGLSGVKFIASFALPLGLGFLGLLCAAALIVLGRPRGGAAAVVGITLTLWLLSSQVISNAIAGHLEDLYPPTAVAASPRADAILLLSGGVSPAIPPRLWSDLGGASDRVLHAARLYRAGKAPLILATGGSWVRVKGAQSEAGAMADLLVEWGVPRRAILLETKARTTHQNCMFAKPILRRRGIHSVLLVTSAMHMKRALATCRTAGIDAIPSPTDFEVTSALSPGLMRWRPESAALDRSSRAIWEILGFLYYRTRGWIRPEHTSDLPAAHLPRRAPSE